MDPQKNPQSPAQGDDQRPAAAQMPADSPEVTVDFSQPAPGASPTAQPGGAPNDLSSFGTDPTVPANSIPVGAQPVTGNDPFSAAPTPANDPGTAGGIPPVADGPTASGLGATDPSQPLGTPQDSYGAGPAAPGAVTPQTSVADQPLSSFPGPNDPGVNPAAQSQPFGTPDDQQSAVPPTAPVSSVKADKKTIAILAAVAVVLIAAIGILVFM